MIIFFIIKVIVFSRICSIMITVCRIFLSASTIYTTGGIQLEYENYIKISPCIARGACPSSCCYHQQLWRCSDALFRHRNIRYFQRSLRIFLRISQSQPGDLDLHIPGTSGAHPNDPAKKIRPTVSVQLCGRICFWRTAGCT